MQKKSLFFSFISRSPRGSSGFTLEYSTNVRLSLSSIPTIERFDFICKNAETKNKIWIKCGERLAAWVGTIRLVSSRDKNEGTYVPKWGGRRRARYVTPDLSFYLEGAREWFENNRWDEENKMLQR